MVTKMQAVARGRTGRRRSMEAARERFVGLVKQQETTVKTSRSRGRAAPNFGQERRSATASAPPSNVSRLSGRRVQSRRGVASKTISEEESSSSSEKVVSAVSAAAFAKEVLERVAAREEVTAKIMEWTTTATEDDAAKAKEKVRERGTRWDLNAKIKAREAKVLEQKRIIERLLEQRTNSWNLFAQVERTLLRECKNEAEKAEKAERSLVDGSGLKDKMERLENERDEAKAEANSATLEKTGAISMQKRSEERLNELQMSFEAMKKEKDRYVEENDKAREAMAQLRGQGQGEAASLKEVEHWATSTFAREKNEATTALEKLRLDYATLVQRSETQAEALKEALKISESSKTELTLALKSWEEDKARVARAEGAAKAAMDHCEMVRADLEKVHGVRATEVAQSEAQKRRFSVVTKDFDVMKDRSKAAEAAAFAKAALCEKECLYYKTKFEALEMQKQDEHVNLSKLNDAAKEALAKANSFEEALDTAVTELADLHAKNERDQAATEARIMELRERAKIADEHRVAASKLAAEAAAKASTETARAESKQKELESLKAKTESSEKQLESLKEDLDKTIKKLQETQQNLALEMRLRETATDREESERRERTAALAQLLAIQDRVQIDKIAGDTSKKVFKDTIDAANAAFSAANLEGRRKLEAADALIAERLAEVEALQLQARHSSDIELSHAKGELEGLRRRLEVAEKAALSADAETNDTIIDLQARLRAAEDARRKLHNTIQELRGNIRVFARVRPFLPSDRDEEDDDASKEHLSMTPLQLGADGQSVTLNPVDDADDSLFSSKRKVSHAFAYDKVFGPSDGQTAVFDEVANFVQSALDGYQVCLFAYGQTGSGKTHTMQGSGTGPMQGIIPRTMDQVASYLKKQREHGWQYQLSVTYVEIYNENVRDLLSSFGNGNNNKAAKNNLDVRRDAKTGRTYADGATAVPVDPVSDPSTVEKLLALAAKTRCVASTDMNAQSSRSHAVFTLHLDGKNESQNISLHGALHLVDLAGSERLDRSGAIGQRAKEAAAINKSLSALANVFNGLANKQKHVAFRDSKLTFLLQSAMSQGKTLVIVNLSPTLTSFPESLQTLTFASRVSKIELGVAQRDIVTNS